MALEVCLAAVEAAAFSTTEALVVWAVFSSSGKSSKGVPMRYEIIENDVVVNTIMADAEFMSATFAEGSYRAVPEPPAEPELRRITRLAFLDRFTDAEAVAIDLASMGATVEAASLRRYLSKVNAATFIDLDWADTRAGVQALEAGGLLGEGRALEIMDAPVEQHERPAQ